MESTFFQILSAMIGIPRHRFIIEYLRQKNVFSFCHKVINQLVGIDFIWKGVKSINCMGFSQNRTQSLNNRKRQFIQLLLGELSLKFAHLTS